MTIPLRLHRADRISLIFGSEDKRRFAVVPNYLFVIRQLKKIAVREPNVVEVKLSWQRGVKTQ